MIKLIIFDLWDTLAYRGHGTLKKISEKTGIKIQKRKYIKIYENSVQTKRWKSKFEAYKNLCKNLGIGTIKQNINFLIKIRDKVEAKTKLFPYTIPMLRQLRKQGYKIGLISNTSIFSIEQIKKKTNLLKYIDYPLPSFEVGVIKPNVKIFKEMLRRTKFKPKEVIMIGDTYENDILPARSIGMNAIHLKDYEQLKKELVEFEIRID